MFGRKRRRAEQEAFEQSLAWRNPTNLSIEERFEQWERYSLIPARTHRVHRIINDESATFPVGERGREGDDLSTPAHTSVHRPALGPHWGIW